MTAARSEADGVCDGTDHAVPAPGGWLALAATPTFAVMALLTAVPDGDAYPMTCLGEAGASPLHGMTAMYLLMAVFHAAPWLNLASRRLFYRSDGQVSPSR